MRPIIVRLGLALAVVVLVATSAVAGRFFLPDLPILPTTSGPNSISVGASARVQVLEIRRDFDALVSTLRSLPTMPDQPTVVFLTPKQRTDLQLSKRVDALDTRLRMVRGLLPEAEGHYRIASSDLYAAALLAEHTPQFGSFTTLRDLLNQAEAEWRKGDDILR